MKNKDIANDIGELKLALHKLRESEIKYRTLFDNANDGIFLVEERYHYRLQPEVPDHLRMYQGTDYRANHVSVFSPIPARWEEFKREGN